MEYRVQLGKRAERDLALIFLYANAEFSETALDWYFALKRAILSLRRLPHRCASTPENLQLRQLLYGDKPHIYRIIFRINEGRKLIKVLHVRHGARRPFKSSEVQ